MSFCGCFLCILFLFYIKKRIKSDTPPEKTVGNTIILIYSKKSAPHEVARYIFVGLPIIKNILQVFAAKNSAKIFSCDGSDSQQNSQLALYENSKKIGEISWNLTGEHNRNNACAAILAAQHVGVDFATSLEALSQFENVKRRMKIRGKIDSKNITVYDDFAHHPTAITTTLNGLRNKVGNVAKIIAVFEPRSNTMKLGTMKAR